MFDILTLIIIVLTAAACANIAYIALDDEDEYEEPIDYITINAKGVTYVVIIDEED